MVVDLVKGPAASLPQSLAQDLWQDPLHATNNQLVTRHSPLATRPLPPCRFAVIRDSLGKFYSGRPVRHSMREPQAWCVTPSTIFVECLVSYPNEKVLLCHDVLI